MESFFPLFSFLLASLSIIASFGVNGAAVQFNTTVLPQCQTAPGCQLNDSTIYEGGILPVAEDTLNITVPSLVLLYLPTGTTFTVDSLYLSGPVSLLVQANAALSVSSNLDSAQALITVSSSGSLLAAGDVSFSDATAVTLYGRLQIRLSLVTSTTTLSVDSSITGNEGSSFVATTRDAAFYGSLSFSANSTFSVYAFALYAGAIMVLPNNPFLGWATLQNINATFVGGLDAYDVQLISSNIAITGPVGGGFVFGGFSADANSQVRVSNASVNILNALGLYTPGFGGLGSYVISSSEVHASLARGPLNSTFLLLGRNNISVYNFIVNSSQLNFGVSEEGEVPYTSFEFRDYASISGDIDFPGEISITSDTQLLLNGSISFSGPFSSDTIYGPTNTTINGSLNCQSIVLAYSRYAPTSGSNQNPSLLTTINATIISESIQISGNASIQSTNTSHYFVATFTNNGTLSASETNNIILEGNYTQLELGTFLAYDLSTAANRSANLVVKGNAALHGAVNYSTIDKPGKKQSYVVLEASNVTGTFFKGLYAGRDESKFTETISYFSSSVEIVIGPKSLSWLGLEWWIWVIIGAAAVVAIIVLIVVGLKFSQRNRYEPVK